MSAPVDLDQIITHTSGSSLARCPDPDCTWELRFYDPNWWDHSGRLVFESRVIDHLAICKRLRETL